MQNLQSVTVNCVTFPIPSELLKGPEAELVTQFIKGKHISWEYPLS